MRNLFLCICLFLAPFYLTSGLAVINPNFIIANIETENQGNFKKYTVFNKEGSWIELKLENKDNRNSLLSVGKKIRFMEITEKVIKYGRSQFYLRYNLLFDNGQTIHADAQIYTLLNQWDYDKSTLIPKKITKLEANPVKQYVFDGAKYNLVITRLDFNVILDDGSNYQIKSNVHGYIDPNNPPKPFYENDIAFVFEESLVIMDDSSRLREFVIN